MSPTPTPWDPRHPRPQHRSFLGATPVMNFLIGFVIVAFVAINLGPQRVSLDRVHQLVHLSGETLSDGHRYWTILTAHLFPVYPGAFWAFLFDVLFLYWFGKPLEHRFGSRDTLALILGGMVLTSALFLALTWAPGLRLFGGTQAIVYATIFCFAVLDPRHVIYFNFLIPIPIWLLVIVYVAFDLMAVQHARSLAGAAEHLAPLAAAAWGAAFAKLPLGIDRWRDWRRQAAWRGQRGAPEG